MKTASPTPADQHTQPQSDHPVRTSWGDQENIPLHQPITPPMKGRYHVDGD